ncbi:MAG: hypothetical protein D6692_09830 [Planctomycetota bacterium]|nr:MAG: hypothetical protein D6692_09830 [Planctomycetota bacterium]
MMNRTKWRAAWLVGACLAGPAGGQEWTPETPMGVTRAIRAAVEDGRLGVFKGGPDPDGAWGSLCIGSVRVGDDGGVSLIQDMVYWTPRYFYPASTIKLFAAIAAYEQMNAYARMYPQAGLSEHTPLRFYPLFEGEQVRETDPSHIARVPFGDAPITIAHEAHKIFVVSDNDAFNTLYDFVGQRDLNDRMRQWGVDSSMVTHRLSIARTEDENRRAPRVDLGLAPGSPQIGERVSTIEHPGPDSVWVPEETLRMGKGFMRGGTLVEEPFDFSDKNFALLPDLQFVLARLVFPMISTRGCCDSMEMMLGAPSGRALDLTEAQRADLIASASMLPRESASPKYDPAEYPDDYVKFLLPGLLKVAPLEEWRVVNKIGLAYGFVTENAYVEHLPTGNAVFVAAVIHRNPNGIYNDNQYDYDTTLAEMATLGEVVGRALVGKQAGP